METEKIEVQYATTPVAEWKTYDDAKLKEALEWDPILKRAKARHKETVRDTKENVKMFTKKDNASNCYPNLKYSEKRLKELNEETDATIEQKALSSWKCEIELLPDEAEIWTKNLPLEILRQRGIQKVTFGFEGGHDEGGIESCSIVNADGSEQKIDDWEKIYGKDGFIQSDETKNTYLFGNDEVVLQGTWSVLETRPQTMGEIRSSGVVNLRNTDWSAYHTFETGEPLTFPIQKNFGGFALEHYIYGTLIYELIPKPEWGLSARTSLGSARLVWGEPLPATARETYASDGGSTFVHEAD